MVVWRERALVADTLRKPTGLLLFGGVLLMQVPADLAILSLGTLAVVAREYVG